MSGGVKIFRDDKIVNGIFQINDCVDGINAAFESRGMESVSSANDCIESISCLNGPTFSGVSLNSMYGLKNGILYEKKNVDKKIAYKVASGISEFYPGNENAAGRDTWKQMMLSNYLSSSLNENLSSYKKRADAGKNLNFLYKKENYFTPTVISGNAYDFFFESTDALSSASVYCTYFIGGMNHAFRNCKNLESFTLNVRNAHYDVITSKSTNDFFAENCRTVEDVKRSSYVSNGAYISSFVKPAYGFMFSKSISSDLTSFADTYITYYNTGSRMKLVGDSRTLSSSSGSRSFFKAFEGCDNLKTISFPNLYESDFIDPEDPKKLSSIEELRDWLGLSAEQETTINFKR